MLFRSLLAVGAGFAAGAVDYFGQSNGPHDSEAPDTSSGAQSALERPVATTLASLGRATRSLPGVRTLPMIGTDIYRNSSNLPTQDQLTHWMTTRHRQRPTTIVAREVTVPPGYESLPNGNLTEFASMAGEVCGSNAGGGILATLFSVETGAGVRPSNTLACYNYNPGNQKVGSTDPYPNPCYFQIGRAHV